ncbi:MAG TPA: M23 family metallopeptidase, partial [Stenomitos sp.]
FLTNPAVERLLQRAETLLYPLISLVPVTSGFGWRTHPIFGNARFHAGIDLGAPSGSPVLAVFSGKVVAAEWLGGYGNAVVLEHQSTLRSLYAHLNKSLVAVGQVVPQGAVIGLSGSTGNSTGPHLHFELQRLESGQWVAFDPSRGLRAAQEQLLATRTKQFTSSIPKNLR